MPTNNNNKGLSSAQIKAMNEMSAKMASASKDLEGYFKLLGETQELSSQLAFLDEKRANFAKDLYDIKKKILVASKQNNTVLEKQLTNEKKLIESTLVDLEEVHKLTTQEVKDNERILELVKKRNLIGAEMLKGAKQLGKELLSHTGELFEQQKAVKDTELSMGILSNQAGAFRQNIYKTSLTTNQLGIDAKELAAIQGTYSQNVGRALVLSEGQLTAVAELAAGTMLGAEGAAEFAANMDNFGISAEGSAKYVEEIINDTHKMGLNSSKVIKTINDNLKLAQKYHFSGGIKGLSKMAAMATKFKFEMSSIAGFAENMFTPEGAIEAAAKLSVLGGAWAKLGDPFELMYKSRNDIEGLTEDIIDATSATARWDEKKGEFTIDPMELHRLREIAKVTGISAEELATMAKEKAKFSKIESEIGGNFSKEQKEYISSLSSLNSKSGKFEFTFQNEAGATMTREVNQMSDITSDMLESIRLQEQTLKGNALQAQTFDESWTNLINTLKATVLPAFEIVTKSLQDGLNNFVGWAQDSKVFEHLADVMTSVGTVVAKGIELAIENPITTGVLLAIGKAAEWYLRGTWLGMGFKGATAGSGMGASSAWKPGQQGPSATGGASGGARAMSGMKTGALGGLAVGVSSGMGEWAENSANGMDTSENAWRTGMVAGGGVLGGAAIGAALGSVVPVIGTAIGGIVGGMIGAYGGDKLGDMAFDSQPQFNDFISRPGSNPVSFSSKDTLVGAKTGGPIDKMLNGSTSVGSGNVMVTFNKPLKVEGKIDLSSGRSSASIDLNDPILIQQLSGLIQEQLSKSIGGGKTSSNPAFSF